jgi:hypothetical protein
MTLLLLLLMMVVVMVVVVVIMRRRGWHHSRVKPEVRGTGSWCWPVMSQHGVMRCNRCNGSVGPANWRCCHLLPAGCTPQSGVEDLTMIHPPHKYGSHFAEAGHYSIALSGCLNCWIRRVQIFNSDHAISVSSSP